MMTLIEVAARLILALFWALIIVVVVLIALPFLAIESLFNRVNHAG